MTEEESHLATEILQTVSDFERIGDYCVNISETAQFMHENHVSFTENGRRDANLVFSAVTNIVNQTVSAFATENPEEIASIEPLEEVIDQLIETLRNNHVQRLQNGKCNVTSGISFIELLNNMERISDHCSNIAVYIIQRQKVFENFDRHSYLKAVHRGDVPGYQERFTRFQDQYIAPLLCSDKPELTMKDVLILPRVVILNNTNSNLTWDEAIRQSMIPLTESGAADKNYSDTIIRNIEKLGAYYTTAKQTAVLHGRPEDGSYLSQISVTMFRSPIVFPNTGDAPVRLFINLAASDQQTRNRELNLIGQILANANFQKNWQNCESSQALYRLFCDAEKEIFQTE